MSIERRQLIEPPIPTVTRSVFGGMVRIDLFGKPSNWRTSSEAARTQIVLHAGEVGVRNIFCPNPSRANAVIIDPARVLAPSPQHFSSHNSKLYMACDNEGYADGIAHLHLEEAVWLATADCPTVVLTDGNRVMVLHAGRDSLIPRVWLRGEAATIRPSVIENCLRLFRRRNAVSATIVCGISGMHFIHPIDHPEWGPFNRVLIKYVASTWGERCFSMGNTREGMLSLHNLIVEQLVAGGVSRSNIDSDSIDTFSDARNDTRATLSHTWWSHARDGAEGRNGVLVSRIL